ncbi:DUF7402 domain-containing protein [Cohnella herbarum]|uniref:Uncharacterized protein n=1 Tax=Cohnella herbarum TaxID=2728023 RepID=A0A7Z2VRT5_9BACL|nr:discoidin domain-containing protein [Cohnella herbarum]QJD87872.1 hypothetical protein HH215_34890 [Cohnella herbarum]
MHGKARKFTSFLVAAVLMFNMIYLTTPQLAQAAETNIAPQARVTVSSFYGNDPAYAGAHAADGRMDTEWASATSAPWIELDWDNTYEVSKIVIYDRPDGADAIGGVLSFSNGAQVTVSDIPGNGVAKEIVLNSPIVTDSLKFDITGNGWNGVGLVELQVFGVESASGTPVQNISVVSNENTISISGGALQLNTAVFPEDATMKSVTWAVYESDGHTPTNKAEIDNAGLLQAKADGVVRVVAAAKDGSGVTGYKDITINQTVQPGSNIAGGASVTVSTEHSAEYKGAYAVDGQLSTEWASNETKPWIRLDWNEPQTITKLVLYDRADGNNAAGKIVFSNGKEIKVDGVPNDGVTPKTIVLPNPIVATSIKFDIHEGSGGWNVGLREFEVFGYPSGASKPVESIGVSGAGGIHAISAKKGTLQMIASVLPADATNQSVSWAVLEEDGVTPTKKAKIDSQGKLSATADGTVTVVARSKDGSTVDGSVKVTISGQGVDPSMGTNIAGNASVSASTEYSAAYVATNAMDGDIGTEWASKETKPWINLEWEQAQTIHKIIVYDRNDPANADKGIITFSNGKKIEVKDIPVDGSPKEIDLETPIVAKWLRFDISSTTGFNSIGLAEMEVYGFTEGVTTPVASIAVYGETGNSIDVKGGSLKMVAAVTPGDATDQRVKWSVREPDGSATIKASIDQTGTLTASKKKDGDVKVRAEAIDGTGVIGEAIVTLINQEVNANTPPDATATIDFANDTVIGSPYVFGFNKNPMRMHADVMFPKLADIGMTRIRNTVYFDYILKDVCGSLEDWNNNTNDCQNPDNWNWDQFWWVDQAKANHMKVSMIFAYAPSFLTYSGDYFGVPKDWEVYEDIVQKVYLRYKDDIDWVEILNEPDASWFINLEGSGYTRIAFIKDSYYHIAKAIREVDSDVIMGGLSTFEPVTEEIHAVMDDPRITPDMLQYGSFHKYSPQAGKTDIRIFKDAFASRASKGFDANAPIMITEYNTSAGNYEERGFTSGSWLGLQLSGLIKQGYYAADFYAAFPSYQPIYGETDFSEGSVSNFGMYKWDDASGTGDFLPLGYTFKLLSKSLGLGKGEFQVKAATTNGLDDAFGAVNSEGKQVGFVVNESDEVKNIEVTFDNVELGHAEVTATAYMVSGWADGSAAVPVFTRVEGGKVKVSLSLPSHAVAGVVLNLEPSSVVFPVKSLEAANESIAAKPWDYMKLTTDAIQGETIWKSSIPYIGNIDASGRFYALAEGTTTITAESAIDPNNKVEVQIRVAAMNVPLLQIELNQHRIFTMSRNAIQLETTTLKPLEAVSKSLTWKSANPNIASVSQDGRVTIHKEGKAVIRVESSVNPDVYDEAMIVVMPEGNMLTGLQDKVTVSGEQPSDLGRFAIDGNMGSRWSDSNKEAYWLQVDLGEEKEIGRYLIVNAGPFENWLGNKINTRALQLQTSKDGETWVTVDDVKGNTEDILDRVLPAGTKARYVRFNITEPQDPTTMYQAVRIYEIIMLPPQANEPGGGNSSGGSGGSGGSNGSAKDLSIIITDNGVEIKVTANIDNGVLTASVDENAIKQALEKLAKQSGANPMITISVSGAGTAKEVSLQLPTSALKLLSGIGLNVDAGLASMSFDAKALETIGANASGQEVVIRAQAVDTTGLPNPIAGRPAVDLTVKSGDAFISSFGGNVEIAIPYAPPSSERNNAIVPYFIDANGRLKAMRGKFVAQRNAVAFTTSHFSRYAVGYHPVSFKDVADTAWYKGAIDFVAARDIATGTGKGQFSPDWKITRGQMIVMIMRAYGIEPDQMPKDNFADAGQTYYSGYLAAAKRLKLADGIGNNLYMPEQEVTRQDMATTLYRILKYLGQLPVNSDGHNRGSFQDDDQIARYALEAMNYFTASGVITGSSGLLNPKEATTRAQLAQVLYQLLSK